MHAFDKYFYLGKITKLHAYAGKLQVFLDTDEPEKYDTLQVVFIRFMQGPVPYFIENFNRSLNKAIVKFQDVDSPETAKKLVGRDLYLPLEQLSPLSENKFYYHEILGFEVIDKSFGIVGIIKQVLEYPNQAVLSVMHDEKEVLIPINSEVVVKVDREKKQLRIKAPEGLIDIYLA